MNVFTALLPIIVIVIPIVIIFFFVTKAKKMMPKKFTHWLLIGYGSVLVLSYLFISFTVKSDTHLRVEENTDWVDHVDRAVKKGNFADLERKGLVSRSEFPYQEKTLTIQTNRNFMDVYIERKEDNDSKVEVKIIHPSLFVNGINFTDRLTKSTYEVKGNTFTVNDVMQREIRIAMQKKEFPINQFTGKFKLGGSIQMSRSFVYLRVPKHLEVQERPNVSVIYLEEN